MLEINVALCVALSASPMLVEHVTANTLTILTAGNVLPFGFEQHEDAVVPFRLANFTEIMVALLPVNTVRRAAPPRNQRKRTSSVGERAEIGGECDHRQRFQPRIQLPGNSSRLLASVRSRSSSATVSRPPIRTLKNATTILPP